jgi:ATP-dependent HslUV protease subunit HslV
MTSPKIRSTTVIAVHRDGKVALASDGQVTLGDTIVRSGAVKARAATKGQALIGFAGGAADALSLTERLESKLEAYPGNVRRAVVELAKDWRSDRVLRRLEAMLLVGSTESVLVVSGNGDVIEPDDGIAAIGSGGSYALAAARALAANTDLGPAEIAERALHIAAEICIYTTDRVTVLQLP